MDERSRTTNRSTVPIEPPHPDSLRLPREPSTQETTGNGRFHYLTTPNILPIDLSTMTAVHSFAHRCCHLTSASHQPVLVLRQETQSMPTHTRSPWSPPPASLLSSHSPSPPTLGSFSNRQLPKPAWGFTLGSIPTHTTPFAVRSIAPGRLPDGGVPAEGVV